MPTWTIRNVPDELHTALKERARRNRRSLNQEVIAELSSLDPNNDERNRLEQTRERMRRANAKIDAMRAGMTRLLTAEEIDESKPAIRGCLMIILVSMNDHARTGKNRSFSLPLLHLDGNILYGARVHLSFPRHVSNAMTTNWSGAPYLQMGSRP